MKEQLTINFGKYFFGPKTPFHWKKCFSWRLGQFFRCFEWKYCAVSENVFSMSVIYLHFSHCKFSFFWWIDWVRFKTRLAKDPILELADWTGLVCKFSEFDLCHHNWNVTKTEMLPKLKCQRNWNVTKTEMSPKLKSHQN